MRRLLATGFILAVLLVGCRGRQSDAPPIHPNLNMDFQEKFQPQGYNPLFENKAVMRPPSPGTVARGHLRDSSGFYQGRTDDGDYVERVPIRVNRAVLERGQDRYDIYCAPCHGRTGAGNGIIMRGNYGYTPAPSYHQDGLRRAPNPSARQTDGYLYDVIANGVRNMPGYAQQIPVRDRWAIVTYIRALQRSQHAEPENLPESVVARIQEETGATVESGPDATGDGSGSPSSE